MILGFTWRDDDLMACQYLVDTEPGIQSVVNTYGKKHDPTDFPGKNVTLYLGNTSGSADLASLPWVRKMASGNKIMAVVDPRGMGHSTPLTCGNTDHFHYYGFEYNYAAYGLMMNRPYLGQRVFDVLQTMDALAREGAIEFKLVGRGMGSVIAAFAGLLHKSEPRVELVDYLPSYQLIAESPHHKWPLSCFLPGCLKHFDLPDVYKALGKRLKKKHPWNAMMR